MPAFITTDLVARESLRLLQKNIVATSLFDRRFEGSFTGEERVGDTVRVRRRKANPVQEFGPSDTVSLTFAEPEETQLSFQLEKQFSIAVHITSRDLTLSLQDFATQVLEPQIVALVESVDAYALTKVKEVPTVARPSSSAPAALPSSIADLTGVDRTLNEQFVPMDSRWQIVSPEYKATLFSISEIHSAHERGDGGDALRTATLGSFLGMEYVMTQGLNTATHTSGTMTSALVNGAVAAGSTSIPFNTASGATATLKKYDLITIAGYGNATVAADVTASSSAGTITIFDPLRTALENGIAITVYDGGGNTRQNHGAAFHSSAFGFVSVPMVVPPGVVDGSVITDNGLSIRVLRGFDMSSQKAQMTLDILCGARLVDPRLAAQIVKNI